MTNYLVIAYVITISIMFSLASYIIFDYYKSRANEKEGAE
jgi:hypothetical protein